MWEVWGNAIYLVLVAQGVDWLVATAGRVYPLRVELGGVTGTKGGLRYLVS
jgi:hypothetical protein